MINIKNFFTLKLLSILSKATGLFRDLLMSKMAPICPANDSFYFIINTFFTSRRCLSEGTFDVGFVVLSGNTKDIGSALSHCAMFVLSISCLSYALLYFHTSQIINYFSNNWENVKTVELMFKIVMAYTIFAPFSYLMLGLLQFQKRIFIYGSMPILLNIGIMQGLLVYDKIGLMQSILLINIIQCIISFIATFKYFKKIQINYITKDIIDYLKIVVPLFLTGLSFLSSSLVTLYFTSKVEGITSIYYYIERMRQLPIALIGNVTSIIILPTAVMMYKASNNKSSDEISNALNKIISISLMISIPISFGLMSSIESMLCGVFSIHEQYIGNAIIMGHIMALNIPIVIICKISNSFIVANMRSYLTLAIASFGLISNIILSSILYNIFGVYGALFATSLVPWLSMILIHKSLNVKIYKSTYSTAMICIFKSFIIYICVCYVKLLMPFTNILNAILCVKIGGIIFFVLFYKNIKEKYYQIKS